MDIMQSLQSWIIMTIDIHHMSKNIKIYLDNIYPKQNLYKIQLIELFLSGRIKYVKKF